MSPQAAHCLDHLERGLENRGVQLQLVKRITSKSVSRALAFTEVYVTVNGNGDTKSLLSQQPLE